MILHVLKIKILNIFWMFHLMYTKLDVILLTEARNYSMLHRIMFFWMRDVCLRKTLEYNHYKLWLPFLYRMIRIPKYAGRIFSEYLQTLRKYCVTVFCRVCKLNDNCLQGLENSRHALIGKVFSLFYCFGCIHIFYHFKRIDRYDIKWLENENSISLFFRINFIFL